MSYGYQPAPRKSGMTTAGKWMFIIGLVLAVLAGIVAAWGVSRTVDMAQQMESESVPLAGGAQTVTMEQGDTRMVVTESGASSLSCTVTLPDGSTTSLDGGDTMADTAVQDSDFGLVGTYTATTAGEHRFECEGGGDAMLTPGFGAAQLGGIIAASLGFLALLPLGLLTLVGLILWLVGRGKDRRALEQPVGPGGYGGHGHGYGGDSSAYGRTQDTPGWQGQGYGQQGQQPYGQADQGYGQAPPPPPHSGQAWPAPGQSSGGPSTDDPYASPPSDTDRRGGEGTDPDGRDRT